MIEGTERQRNVSVVMGKPPLSADATFATGRETSDEIQCASVMGFLHFVMKETGE